jgi:hypothetical protein
MPWLRRATLLVVLAVLLGVAMPLADPQPPAASANVVCDPPGPDAKDVVSAVGDAVGIGNPIEDACEAVTDPILGLPSKALDPLKDAASSIGKGVFNQVTSWVADGAVWLIGEVAVLSDKTTSPNLLSKGFLRQYKLMATIAAFMAAVMVIFAIFESLGRGEPWMLWRIFLINVPLAAIATTAAYVVVQLLIVTCDGLSQTISHSAGADSKEFFKGAIEALAKAGATPGAVAGSAVGDPDLGGTTSAEVGGAIAVPLFVGFIAAIVAAFAAFFLWIELLMRDAAIYVVALFMPLAIAASIWPRWVSAMKRTCELLLVIIFSKFVIVAIVSLAASLLAHNEGGVEHVLAAGAMLLLACFAPFVLFKLVPFAESAASAAFSRQSAGGGALRTVQSANSMMMVQRLSRANWAAAGAKEGGGGGSRGAGKFGGGKAGSSGAGAGESAAAGGAAVGAVPVVAASKAAQSGRGAAERLSETGEAKATGEGSGGSESRRSSKAWETSGSQSPPRPATEKGGVASPAAEPTETGGSTTVRPARPGGAAAEPTEAEGGGSGGSARPQRPAVDKAASGSPEAKR